MQGAFPNEELTILLYVYNVLVVTVNNVTLGTRPFPPYIHDVLLPGREEFLFQALRPKLSRWPRPFVWDAREIYIFVLCDSAVYLLFPIRSYL